MLFRIAACALLMAAIAPTSVLAQAYPAATPVARTVAPAQLDAIARDREVAERFRRGLDAASHGDWRTSAAEFTRVVSLDPAEPRGSTAQYDLGIALAHIGSYPAAEAAFHDDLMDLWAARDLLARSGASRPGLLAGFSIVVAAAL